MTKFIIEYESSQWCGGQSLVVVEAEDEDDAQIRAGNHMEESMRELFSDHYDDGEDYAGEDNDADFDADECAYVVNRVEVLDENNEHWSFFTDPSQAEFYPEI